MYNGGKIPYVLVRTNYSDKVTQSLSRLLVFELHRRISVFTQDGANHTTQTQPQFNLPPPLHTQIESVDCCGELEDIQVVSSTDKSVSVQQDTNTVFQSIGMCVVHLNLNQCAAVDD